MKTPIFTLLGILLSANLLFSQAKHVALVPESLEEIILELDRNFWLAYNSCDIEKFRTFMTDDFEFYHDKGGLTKSLTTMMEGIEQGLCGDENTRVRRQVVDGSVEVFPLNNYGAIISGEHTFYLKLKDKKEQLTGIARFTHVWQFENEQWKMSRVLSYDHQPFSENSDKKELSIAVEDLEKFVGSYLAPETGTVNIAIVDDKLEIKAGEMQSTIYPESDFIFYHKDSPLTFEFAQDAEGQIGKIIVREQGQIVEEAKKIRK